MSSAALALGVTSIVVNGVLFPTLPKPTVPVLVQTSSVFKDVVSVLSAKSDYDALGSLVHSKGVSVYYSPTSPEVRLTQREVRKLEGDSRKRNFGTAPASGMPLELTGDQFFFGLAKAEVSKGVGPLPDWTKITASSSNKAFKTAQITVWEGPSHLPAKWSKHPYWSIAYKGDPKVSNFDAAEVRVVFDVDTGVKGTPYRVVAFVLAAPYSP